MKKGTFCVFMISRLHLFSSHENNFFFFLHRRVGHNLQNTKKLKPNDEAGKEETHKNLGIVYQNSSDIHKAIEYLECHLQTAKEVVDKAGEGRAYGNIGISYQVGRFS